MKEVVKEVPVIKEVPVEVIKTVYVDKPVSFVWYYTKKLWDKIF